MSYAGRLTSPPLPAGGEASELRDGQRPSNKQRPQGRSGGGQRFDCCVCLESAFTEREILYPFACVHHLCDDCNHKLQSRGNLRCPQCRKPRHGYTEADAQRSEQAEWPVRDSDQLGFEGPSPPGITLLSELLASPNSSFGHDGGTPFIVLNLPRPPAIAAEPEGEGNGQNSGAHDALQRQLTAVAGMLTNAFNRMDTMSTAEFRRVATDAVDTLRAQGFVGR